MRELNGLDLFHIHGGADSKGYDFQKLLSLGVEGLLYGTLAAFCLANNDEQRKGFIAFGGASFFLYGIAKMTAIQLDQHFFSK